MYNNEQVSKVFIGRISAKTCLKMDYFRSKSKKFPSAGGSAPDPLASGARLD